MIAEAILASLKGVHDSQQWFALGLKKAFSLVGKLSMLDVRGRTIHILIVEDNAGDVFLIREGLIGTGGPVELHVAKDGVKAMEFIERAMPRPDLVLLDLNIPGLSGHEVLKRIKGNPALMEIPVVIFSSSGSAKDIRTAYQLNANSYVRKPSDVDEFFEAIQTIERFWAHTAARPAT